RSKIPVRGGRAGGRSEQRRQNLSASGGCSRAQVHRRTQDNGFDCHASIRVSGSKKRLRGTQSRKRIPCRSYATKLDRCQTRIAVSRSLARQSFTATSPISPASPPTQLSAI